MVGFRFERVTWAERALWAAFVAVSVASVALKPGAEEVARGYVAAVNRGDVEAALDMTATDFVLRPALGGYYYRREPARQVLKYRAALNERWRVLSWAYNGQEIHADLEVTNDAWTLLESRPQLSVILVVRNGRLLVETIRTDPNSMRRTLQPFLEWASAERPWELSRVWRGGQLVRTADSALRLVVLLREWRAASDRVANDTEWGQA
jgi:hypothetical protein